MTSAISFNVRLSREEVAAIKRILSGNKVKFEVLKEARLEIKVQVQVKEGSER